MKNEPLRTVAGITAAVSAVLTLLVAFGVNLTDAQNTAILGVAGVLAPLVVAWVAWVARRKVMPASKLRDPLPPTE
jgi:predicted amino acid dehydrogenase